MRCRNRCLAGFLASVFFLVFSAASLAASPVWRLSDVDGRVDYIAATMHLLQADDYPLPQGFNQAYRAATELVFETDLYAMQDDEFARRLQQQGFYPAGTTLQQVLDKPSYALLADYARRQGMDMAAVAGMKVGLLLANISLHELQQRGLSSTGVDLHFLKRALVDKKAVYSLESLEQQIDYVVNMGQGYESELVSQSLAELAQLDGQLETLRTAWRSGDLETLDRLLNRELKEKYPPLYRRLLLHRNAEWLPLLRSQLARPGVSLVLVGAAHLPGEDGLLRQLQAAGWHIEQLP